MDCRRIFAVLMAMPMLCGSSRICNMVTDCGAVADNSTNIAPAIDSCRGTCTNLYFPPGSYISNTLNFSNSAELTLTFEDGALIWGKADPSTTATPTATSSATGTRTATLTATSTRTGTATGTSTGTATMTGTSTSTGSSTATSTSTGSSTSTATSTPSQSVTGTATGTSTGSATGTSTGSSTSTATSTPSQSVTGTATGTSTGSATGTSTGSVTSTATGTASQSVTGTATATSTGTASQSVTGTATATSTGTASQSVTGTATATSTGTGTTSVTATATATSSGTGTTTASPSLSATPSITPSATPSPQLLLLLQEKKIGELPAWITLVGAGGGGILVGLIVSCFAVNYCACCRPAPPKARDAGLPIGRGRALAQHAARLVQTTSGRVLVALGASRRNLIPLASPVPVQLSAPASASVSRSPSQGPPPDPRIEELKRILAAPDPFEVDDDNQAFHMLFLGRPVAYLDWAINNAKAAAAPIHAQVTALEHTLEELKADPKTRMAFGATAVDMVQATAGETVEAARLRTHANARQKQMAELISLLEAAQAKVRRAENKVRMYERLVEDLKDLKETKQFNDAQAAAKAGETGGTGGTAAVMWGPRDGPCPVCGNDPSTHAAAASRKSGRNDYGPSGVGGATGGTGGSGEAINPLHAPWHAVVPAGLEDDPSLTDVEGRRREAGRLMASYQPKHARMKKVAGM